MRDIIGIICEYNPFHKGHKYQIDKIKEKMPDAILIGIMSGNVVQRGELSLFDRYRRASLAAKSGLDGVFEIPYPYCGSTAEIFANAGVEIASQIGCTHICFGIENSKIAELEKIAEAIDSEKFNSEIEKIINNNTNYLEAKEIALKNQGYFLPKNSNDILALEYIRAIKNKNINLKYFSFERIGAKYNDLREQEIMSASAIREYFKQREEIVSIPSYLENDYCSIINEGEYICSDLVNDFLFRFAIITPREYFDNSFDSCLEIGAIIKNSAKSSKNSSQFFEKLNSKSYTTSRIKRILIYTLVGVKSIDKKPTFSVLLYANDKCKEILKNIRKNDKFSIITKMSDSKQLDVKSKEQFNVMLRLNEIYYSFYKKPKSSTDAYVLKPIIE
ncbi:MAG: nucleotidyltransferase family protein [Clostridia bacterium]|nr:nucleotidyltransferase family protein [Clostridia bacterium]